MPIQLLVHIQPHLAAHEHLPHVQVQAALSLFLYVLVGGLGLVGTGFRFEDVAVAIVLGVTGDVALGEVVV